MNLFGHAAIVGLVKDVLPETQAGLLVASRPWPLLAARMNQIREQGGPALLAVHLARLTTDTGKGGAWKGIGCGSAAAGRLVDATLHALTTPPSVPPAPASPVRIRVSAAAARTRSTTTPATGAPGQPARAEAAVPAHRQQAVPGKGAGRSR
ncbi:hypothetical protein ACGFXC_32950 [Streptomyces sp. NPDC048507]|uniref:hypothetical protein n=1 Tax=Streptomyces sp. NPDC048507 TaxID=3365560 RepID=UPI0037216EA5